MTRDDLIGRLREIVRYAGLSTINDATINEAIAALEIQRNPEALREFEGLAAVVYSTARSTAPGMVDLDPLRAWAEARLAREAELVSLVEELATELEAEINERYDADHPDGIHPALVRRYERDMDTVRRARAALNPGGGR